LYGGGGGGTGAFTAHAPLTLGGGGGGGGGASYAPGGSAVLSAAGTPAEVVISYSLPSPGCVVPRVKGKTFASARAAIRAAHCQLGKVTHAHSTDIKSGRVISQEPRSGTRLPNSSKVQLVLSLGKRR
jgi:beta-lactam-binding protein with PASTA domain